MSRRSRPLQGPNILLIEADRGRNKPCHTFNIKHATAATNATGINEVGEIVGWYTESGVTHGFSAQR